MSAGLVGYTIRRLLWAIPVLVVLSMIVFWILRLAPGDPVDVILGQRYDEQRAARLRDKYGYDEPIYVQYWTYMGNLAHGDMGVSTRHTDFTVSEVIWPKIKVSTQLGAMALIISFGIGIPVGIYAAMARGTFLDPLVISFWLLIDAIPTFVVIPIFIWLFALKLDIIGLGWEGVWDPFFPIPHPNVILPVLIMSLPGVAGIARFTRASVVSVMHEDYVRTARAKGLKESTVVLNHITRNAMLPLITVIGLSLPGLVTGAIFVETFFGIPGIARESLAAVTGPDFDVILGLVLFGSFLFVMANVLIDITYALVDPRIRVGSARGG
jgi:ABC-type dipeptide/oligopeptide/nickel transport system permease component